MRLQLTLSVLSLCACGPTSATSGGSVRHFQDEAVSVTTPAAEGSVTYFDELTVAPSWKADVITAATPTMSAADVVSRATEYVEVRHEVSIAFDHARDGDAFDASVTLSAEPDYLSHTLTLGRQWSLLAKRAELGVRLSLSTNSVGRSDVSEFSERLGVMGFGASWSHVMSPTLVLQGSWGLEHRRGYQSNPYRYVPIYGAGPRPVLVLPESVPVFRTGTSVEGVAIWAATASTYVHGAVRLHTDDWGVRSVALRGELWQSLGADAFRVRLRGRVYQQSSANFYAPQYDSPDGWRSGDFRLSRMGTVSLGPKGEFRLRLGSRRLVIWAVGDAVYFWMPEYLVRTSMLASYLGTGISVDFK